MSGMALKIAATLCLFAGLPTMPAACPLDRRQGRLPTAVMVNVVGLLGTTTGFKTRLPNSWRHPQNRTRLAPAGARRLASAWRSRPGSGLPA